MLNEKKTKPSSIFEFLIMFDEHEQSVMWKFSNQSSRRVTRQSLIDGFSQQSPKVNGALRSSWKICTRSNFARGRALECQRPLSKDLGKIEPIMGSCKMSKCLFSMKINYIGLIFNSSRRSITIFAFDCNFWRAKLPLGWKVKS